VTPCATQQHRRKARGEERERGAIAAYGAAIVRVEGNYDESVDAARRLATTNGWYVGQRFGRLRHGGSGLL
jgi:threonine dehydratase